MVIVGAKFFVECVCFVDAFVYGWLGLCVLHVLGMLCFDCFLYECLVCWRLV